ncbi:hypothetical protein GTO91_12645 [Heliobacterium undosum]|uniref:YceG-like family protein n=1 Tax=Heliomicrobium undosum TaxID=121734 RepID=A0A845L1Y1_9FIRM|nr:endolytic transglycosylase MltG [Heliomicrobium undosum]MZP30562.1 hypothetical protein [Heliomicrobium undosum]
MGLLLFGFGLVLQSFTGTDKPAQTTLSVIDPQGAESASQKESTPQVQKQRDAQDASIDAPPSPSKGSLSAKHEPVSLTITVTSGDTSETVAQKLKAIGVIADAERFNRYLVENGYATRIQDGTLSMSVGLAEEEIAKRLVGMR